jgi:hypothetical protein
MAMDVEFQDLQLVLREELTLLEQQQAGYNIDPVVTGFCGAEPTVQIQVEDSKGIKKDCIYGTAENLSKSGWFEAAMNFNEQQLRAIKVSGS